MIFTVFWLRVAFRDRLSRRQRVAGFSCRLIGNLLLCGPFRFDHFTFAAFFLVFFQRVVRPRRVQSVQSAGAPDYQQMLFARYRGRSWPPQPRPDETPCELRVLFFSGLIGSCSPGCFDITLSHLDLCSIFGPTLAPSILPPIKSAIRVIAPNAQQFIKIQSPRPGGWPPLRPFEITRLVF